ncbi:MULTISPECIES: serine/threonine-protein kinase [unclassified Streptomyces]|uniref:serine/threonine-protein kinase n=1 Tax=unclassified Streptomyces TaxID=2593676 RepID=UPI002255E60B|nr:MULTISPECIES: serine/threonine-protein kinase [unclassified Streptomyces]MCX4852123.1 serine/threonine protein kinase [Streptomyces sp. NBC_00893]MCX5434039.1 serine/threonine protein kinase [Streptomyces sp. NBC_00062]
MDGLGPSDPRSVGPYRLLGRLGSGGMGRVYLGRSPSGRRVAVKVVRDEIADDPGFRARFRREAELAMRVGGFWTAAVVEADPGAPEPWIASEYIPGPSLQRRIADDGPFSAAEVRDLGVGLAEALASIHALGLVHRDLKPSNVLLADTGPRVIDFGISKALEGSGASTALTHTGVVIGTPGFMSPEQATGAKVGTASDVFSLGAVLAYAATGTEPFGAGTPVALLYRVVSEEPDLSAVPYELRHAIALCLAKDPARRPSPGALVALLTDGEHPTEPVPAPLSTVAYTRNVDAAGGAGPETSARAGVEEAHADTPLELVDGGGARFREIRLRRLFDAFMWLAVLGTIPLGVAITRGIDVVANWVVVLAVYLTFAVPVAVYFWAACRPFREASELSVGRNGVVLRRGHDTAELPWREFERVLVSVGSAPYSVTLFCRFRALGEIDITSLPVKKIATRPPLATFTLLALNRAERNASCSEIHQALGTFAPPGVYQPHPKVLKRTALQTSTR